MTESPHQKVWQMEIRSLVSDLPDDDPAEGAWRITRAEAMASRLVAQVTLHVTQHYGAAAVADFMGISRQAMHERVNRAKERLA